MESEEKRLKHNEYMREWRKKNPQNSAYQKEYHKKYYSGENAEIAKRRSRKFYEQNKEYVKKRELEHYHKNKVLKGRPFGENNPMWKGDSVGYHGLHKWVAKQRGKPSTCELCGTTKSKQFYWANKSHEYKRELDDWLRLCAKCHWRYDNQHLRERGWHGQLL